MSKERIALACLVALAFAPAAAAASSTTVKRGLRSHVAQTSALGDGPALPKSLSTKSILPRETPRTAAPDRRGWKDAVPIAFSSNNHDGCKAKQLREWVMIRCEMWADRVDLVAGAKAGVDAWLVEGDANTPSEAVLVFPMRRGDRRVVQLSARSRYSTIPEVIVTEMWLADEPVPTIIVQRV